MRCSNWFYDFCNRCSYEEAEITKTEESGCLKKVKNDEKEIVNQNCVTDDALMRKTISKQCGEIDSEKAHKDTQTCKEVDEIDYPDDQLDSRIQILLKEIETLSKRKLKDFS